MPNKGKHKRWCVRCGEYLGMCGAAKKYCGDCLSDNLKQQHAKYMQQDEKPSPNKPRYISGFENIIQNYKSRRTPEEYQRCLAIAKGC